MTLRPSRLPDFAGVLFLALMAAAVAARVRVATEDGAPAAQWRDAVEAGGAWLGVAALLTALAGLSLALFVHALHRALARGGGLPGWGRFAGLAWAGLFLASGAVLVTAHEMAGHQDHAEGAKTVVLLAHLLYANPVGALLGGILALAVGRAARAAGLPAWYRGASLALGGLTLATTLLGALGGIGLVGMGPLALWTLASAALLALRRPD